MKAKRDSKGPHVRLLTGAKVASVPSGAPDLPTSGVFQASGVLRASWARSALWKTSCEEIKIFWTLKIQTHLGKLASPYKVFFFSLMIQGDTLYLDLILGTLEM